jgi:hypothetical protein
VASPAANPGSSSRPKKYCVPSSSVTTKYSPPWLPLEAPVSACTRSPPSFCGWYVPSAPRTRTVVAPLSDSVSRLSFDQQSSDVLVAPAGFCWHDW